MLFSIKSVNINNHFLICLFPPPCNNLVFCCENPSLDIYHPPKHCCRPITILYDNVAPLNICGLPKPPPQTEQRLEEHTIEPFSGHGSKLFWRHGGDLYDIKWVVLMLAYECAYKIVCPNPKPHDKKKITDGQKL